MKYEGREFIELIRALEILEISPKNDFGELSETQAIIASDYDSIENCNTAHSMFQWVRRSSQTAVRWFSVPDGIWYWLENVLYIKGNVIQQGDISSTLFLENAAVNQLLRYRPDEPYLSNIYGAFSHLNPIVAPEDQSNPGMAWISTDPESLIRILANTETRGGIRVRPWFENLSPAAVDIVLFHLRGLDEAKLSEDTQPEGHSVPVATG